MVVLSKEDVSGNQVTNFQPCLTFKTTYKEYSDKNKMFIKRPKGTREKEKMQLLRKPEQGKGLSLDRKQKGQDTN